MAIEDTLPQFRPKPPGALGIGVWDPRPHGWVGTTFGPLEVLGQPTKKNPGGDVTREASGLVGGTVDPWRHK